MSNFQDRIAGIGFYQLLKDLDENFDEKKAELIKNLQTLMKYIFRKENLTVSYTADETGYAPLEEKIAAFKENLYTNEVEPGSIVLTLNRKTKPSRPPARYSTWHSVETSSAKATTTQEPCASCVSC